jgi:hypothetical protein
MNSSRSFANSVTAFDGGFTRSFFCADFSGDFPAGFCAETGPEVRQMIRTAQAKTADTFAIDDDIRSIAQHIIRLFLPELLSAIIALAPAVNLAIHLTADQDSNTG